MENPDGLFAGFDVGTQGLKGLLIDARSRRVVARGQVGYGLLPGLAPGAAEQHPDTWIQALGEVARQLFGAPGVETARLSGIGISGQQHGLVVLDGEDRPLRAAKLWCDTQTAAEARELSVRLGRPVPTGFTAPKVLWLARHEPETWRRTRRVLLPHDYVNLVLSGSAWCEAGDASGTGWFDPRTRAVDADSCAAVAPDLLQRLPPLAEAGSLPGRLSERGAGVLGLDSRQVGVPLSTGAGDNMASAIGAGATREGVAVLSLGTSATIFAHSSRAVVDPGGLIAAFCDSTGGWLPLLCVMNATGALEEVRALFGASHAELERLAAELPCDPEGPLCLPFFQGERVPDLPLARAAFVGLGPGSLTRGRLYRACLEGVALNLAAGVERMRLLGLGCERLFAVGGGARNRLWLELVASAAGAEIVPLAEGESAALGAALQALWSVRRSEGHREACGAVAEDWVLPQGEPVLPDAGLAHSLAVLRARFQAAQAGLYPASSGSG